MHIAEVLNHEVDEARMDQPNHIGRVRRKNCGLSTSNKPLSERIEKVKRCVYAKAVAKAQDAQWEETRRCAGSFRQLATMA